MDISITYSGDCSEDEIIAFNVEPEIIVYCEVADFEPGAFFYVIGVEVLISKEDP